MTELGAACAAEILLWVKKESDPSWVDIAVDSNTFVARLTKKIAEELHLTERSSILTLHSSNEEGALLGPPLDSRMTVAAAGLTNGISIVVKAPAPAPIGAGGPAAAGAGAGGPAAAATPSSPAAIVGVEANVVALFAELKLTLQEQTKSLTAVLTQHTTPDVHFSQPGASNVERLLSARGLKQKGRRPLPMCNTGAITIPSFVWLDTDTEPSRSAELLAALDLTVKTGAIPAIDNVLRDVQAFARHAPLVVAEEGVAIFRGAPDCIYLNKSLDITDLGAMSSCRVSIDWKKPAAFAKKAAVAAQATVQAVALAEANGAAVAVFFTDLSSGFRCWIVDNDTVHRYHAEEDLTLTEGVALIRWFLQQGAAASPTHRRLASVVEEEPTAEGHEVDGGGGTRAARASSHEKQAPAAREGPITRSRSTDCLSNDDPPPLAVVDELDMQLYLGIVRAKIIQHNLLGELHVAATS